MDENRNVEILQGPNHVLGEGPIWDSQRERLLYVDIEKGELWCRTADLDEPELVYAVTEENPVNKIGGFTINRDGSLILFTDIGISRLRSDGSLEELQLMDFGDGERFNDVFADPGGRVFAGTMHQPDHFGGILFRVEAGESPESLLQDLKISNGMAISKDQRTFFHIDTIPRKVYRFDYDIKSGEIRNPGLVLELPPGDGMPDGMTIDEDDRLWIACYGGSQILVVNADGSVAERIPLPAKQPTSLTFGGPEYTNLYITTTSQGAIDPETGKDNEGSYLGGRILMIHNAGTGRPEFQSAL